MKKILILISLFIFSGFGLLDAKFEADHTVRIVVLKNADNFIISMRGKYQFIDLDTNQVLKKGRTRRRLRVKTYYDGMTIGKDYFPTKNIRIIANKDITIYKNNKKKSYREKIDILRNEEDQFIVINKLSLERYVRGVLYHEVSNKWPMEAMKAQAVATRTYALYKMDENHNELYDVTSDIYSQVYGGRSAERFRTNLAAERTEGEVLVYDGKIIPAYFHANSGGHTEDVSELWKHDLPPLKGKPDEYVNNAPAYRWKKNFRLKEIQEKLNDHGYKLDLIKEIEIIDRTESGRIKQLKITERNGDTLYIKGSKFRNIIGPNNIRSNLYEVTMKGYFVDFVGKGWGHGVGMSQWGAHTMAKERFKYDEILKYYYPGVKVVSLKDLK